MARAQLYPLLRPLMSALHFSVGRRLNALPQPLDAPHVHSQGADPDRVLLFGSGPAMGYGVLSNDLGLAGQLARQLATITGRGVDLDVVADSTITVERSVPSLRALNLWRYDAIVLTVGVNDALLLGSVRRWREGFAALVAYVTEHVPQRTRVLVVAIPPIRSLDPQSRFSGWVADKHAAVLNREAQRMVESLQQFTFVPFAPSASGDDIRFRSAATYQKWAGLIAAPLGAQLGLEPRDVGAEASPDESARQAALERLNILDTEPEERFDRITRLASQLFGTMSALTFIDHDRHWVKSSVGTDRTESPRAGSFGETAIHSPGVFVVEDAADYRDPEDYYGIRFYAGYPIESAFGERIGLISVFSFEPRAWSTAETELLRGLALQVQRELIDAD